MARIFITGSSDGLGQIIARSLIAQGHKVTLHARSAKRAEEAMAAAPGAEGVLIADLSSISQTKQLASEANKTGVFDTVIHNAAVGFRDSYRKTEDGIEHVFAINSLAPYILTCLMEKPKKLLYMSSGMHSGGDESLKDVTWTSGRRWNSSQAYSDSKYVI
jgi:NAD(P)-dependent dehydrogenase (short-subunit alcohol dehydrogenase family)